MRNENHILAALDSAYGQVKGGTGSSVIVIGESGIGKTHLAESFLASHKKEPFVVRVKGVPTANSDLSAIYDSLYHAISQNQVKKEYYVGLLKRYTKILPGFGQFVSPLVDYHQREALGDVLTRSGISIGTSPNPHIIRFIQEIAQDRTVIIFSDDSQWLDSASWGFIVYLVENIKQLGWLFLFLYNDTTHTWANRNEHFNVIEYWRTHSDSLNLSFYSPQRWSYENLLTLCSNILGKKCYLDDDQLTELLKTSSGIPQYVKSILDVLKNRSYLVYTGDTYVGKGKWSDIDISKELRDSIGQKLRLIYHSVKNSRPILEIASVIGEQFRDDDIDSLLNLYNSYELLSTIATGYGVLKYLFEDREWAFSHTLIHQAIYRSLGPKSRELHAKIAEYLEKEDNASAITIAFHYHQAGSIEKSIHHKMKEIESLLNIAMFNSALLLSDDILAELEKTSIFLDEEKLAKAKMLRGRCLFHLNNYKEAISEFAKIQQLSIPQTLMALNLRWTGRSYTSLDTQEEAEFGLQNLKKAVKILEKTSDLTLLGETLIDLVVTYAHLNRFQDAEEAFARAEDCFNQTKDAIGMARLQRRNTIFMDGRLSTPILLRVAETFRKHDVPHERIMTLINASATFLYQSKIDQAQELLETALKESTEIGDFCLDGIYNNLALVRIMQDNLPQAKECITHARKKCIREGSNAILDINDAVIDMLLNGYIIAEPMLRRALRRAYAVGEQNYIIPAAINLGYALVNDGRYNEVKKLLESLKPINMKSLYLHSHYYNSHWYRLLSHCYSMLEDSDSLSEHQKRYGWCADSVSGAYYEQQFAVITMQFWSD